VISPDPAADGVCLEHMPRQDVDRGRHQQISFLVKGLRGPKPRLRWGQDGAGVTNSHGEQYDFNL
jgi:hypothetical protein